MGRVAVYLEVTEKRAFAGAMDWPGWCRSGRTEEEALEALVAYADRYGPIVASVGGFAPPATVADLDIVERLDGGPTTAFGAPEKAPAADEQALDGADVERQLAILRGCWTAFDAAAAAAKGKELRKGARGGGRSLPKIVAHVAEAERSYLTQLGARSAPEVVTDAQARHDRIAEALGALARGEPIPNASAVRKPWLPRYFVRRAAWHVLDHAWELEDRLM
jgi:hypothetical protein